MNAYLLWYQAVSLELRLLAIRGYLSRAPEPSTPAGAPAVGGGKDDDWLTAYV